MDFEVFLQAGYGRCAPGPSDVAVEGDTDLGRRIVDNLAFMI
jgi:hypothetical protein